MSLIRSLAFAIGGALSLWALPQAWVVSASQEIIAFLALLMAGLLPAMILTATILRAGGLSAKRVEEYGNALKLQLRFWAALFFYAGLSSAGMVAAKILAASGAPDAPVLAETVAIVICGAGLGLVLQRLWPAYNGLLSLLELNIDLAKTEAIAHDRTLRDALDLQARGATPPVMYRSNTPS